jgi:hypothetical protein
MTKWLNISYAIFEKKKVSLWSDAFLGQDSLS